MRDSVNIIKYWIKELRKIREFQELAKTEDLEFLRLVRSVGSKNFETTEGNMSGGIVGHRTVAIGWGYIRGFARPKYAKANNSTPKPEKPDTGANKKPTEATTTAKTYTVKSGDNLTKIANKFGTTVQVLVDLNNIKRTPQSLTGG